MTAAILRKGWCPSLLQPMESGDGWLVRIKPRAASLNASAVRALAEAASRYGNGQIDLTARANLQVRGLSPASAEAFAEIALTHGLSASESFQNPDRTTRLGFTFNIIIHAIHLCLTTVI